MPGTIGHVRVGNRRKSSPYQPEIGEIIVYVDRPNILGNPYIDGSRTENIARFKQDLDRDIKGREGPRYDAVCKIVEHLLVGDDVILACWCRPLACHADLIKDAVENLLVSHDKNRLQRRRMDRI